MTDTRVSSLSRWWMWRWCPSSDDLLEKAEAKMLSGLTVPYENMFVKLRSGYIIRTIVVPATEPCSPERLPLVLLHGFGAGVALWVMNLASLARHQTVYGIDVLGFGRSSRPQFPSDPRDAETLFVESLEDWRHEVGLEKFVLLGHSFGGYLASAYTLSHTRHVRHLVLADPWGIAEKNEETEKSFEIPWWAKGVATVLTTFMNPLAPLRATGPLGPLILHKVRADIGEKFDQFFDGDGSRALDYLYQILVQTPSGETAFTSLAIPFGWARFPMHPRLTNLLDPSVPISVFFGTWSWMYIRAGLDLKSARCESYVDFDLIPEATHHCYADDVGRFNRLVENICKRVYENRDKPGDEGEQRAYSWENLDNFGSFLRPR